MVLDGLRELRTGLGWTQEKLGDESGVNAATINQIERGRRSPKVATLERLAAAMGAEVADFFPKAQSALFVADEPLTGREPALAAADLTSAAVAVPADAMADAQEEASAAALKLSERDLDELGTVLRQREAEYRAALDSRAGGADRENLRAARKRYGLALSALVAQRAAGGDVELVLRQALGKALLVAEGAGEESCAG